VLRASERQRRAELLLPHHPSEVFLGYCQQPFQLAHPARADVARFVSRPGALKQPDRLFVVGFGDVKGVLKGCLMLKRRIIFHATSVVPFPG
jgi:hypothetical protein